MGPEQSELKTTETKNNKTTRKLLARARLGPSPGRVDPPDSLNPRDPRDPIRQIRSKSAGSAQKKGSSCRFGPPSFDVSVEPTFHGPESNRNADSTLNWRYDNALHDPY